MDDHAVFLSHSDFTFKVGRDEYALTDEAELASAAPDHSTVLGEGSRPASAPRGPVVGGRQKTDCRQVRCAQSIQRAPK